MGSQEPTEGVRIVSPVLLVVRPARVELSFLKESHSEPDLDWKRVSLLTEEILVADSESISLSISWLSIKV